MAESIKARRELPMPQQLFKAIFRVCRSSCGYGSQARPPPPLEVRILFPKDALVLADFKTEFSIAWLSLVCVFFCQVSLRFKADTLSKSILLLGYTVNHKPAITGQQPSMRP